MKKIILLIICILLCGILFAEEAFWITTEEISAWIEDVGIKTFPKDTKVMLNDNYELYKNISIDRDGCIEYVRNVYRSGIIVDGEVYYVDAKNIIPIDTPDLFDADFLSVAHYPSRYLVPSYFADVLKSGTRYTMEKYEKYYIKAQGAGTEYDDPWWEYSEITDESIIAQHALRINVYGYFLVKRIEKIPNGYKVEVKRSRLDVNPFFPSDRLEYPLFFQFDGDYVDIYVDNLSNKVISLTYVSPDFYEGVQTVISDNVPVDLSNLVWPRRADGSSDYDNKIIPRQELPQIYRDPLQDTYLVVNKTTTIEELKKSIEKSASMNLLNRKDRYGRPPLETAIADNPNLDIIKLLIESGADINQKNDDGETPLMHAAYRYENFEVMKLLIELGADVHKKNNDGDTSLMIALGGNRHYKKNQHFEIIKLLVESGANVNEKNNYGGTPLHSAGSDTIKLLIESGANINEKASYGSTPLHSAEDIETIKLLIEAGADVNAIDNDGNTPLMGVAEYASPENPANPDSSIRIIKFLIEAGADVNLKDNNGENALLLHLSLISKIPGLQYRSDIMIVKALVEAGADVNIIDNNGNFPMWEVLGRSKIVLILLNAGASLNTVDTRPESSTYGMSILEISQKSEIPSYKILSELIKMGWEENSDDKIIWQAYYKTYLTTDNLRIRATEGVSGNPLFTLPKDTPVQVLSIGSIDKIDDIFAYWVEVRVAEDTVDIQGKEVKKYRKGWCFGGYLTSENIVK